MLIRVGDARTGRIDLALAGVMSFVAGAVNAVGFLIAGAFSANMTGNVSGFAEEAASGKLWLALSFAGLVLAFVVGAMSAALAVQVGERSGAKSVYAMVILAEAAILFSVAGVGLHGDTTAHHEAVIIILCFVMGLQNAATTMISRSRVRTTHVSGMATDIGIEFAALLSDAKSRSDALPKLSLHSLTLACFAAGGVLGALLYVLSGAWLFAIAGTGLCFVALPEVWRSRRGA